MSAGSPAARAGLQAGDVVLRVADKPIDSREKMIDTIHQHRPGDKVALVVHRGDQDLSITATLLARGQTGFATRSDRMNAMGGPLSKIDTGFPPVIQHDTVLRPSDCGGPVVDLSGKVVGINIARAGRTTSYAVPADRVQALLTDLESGRLAPQSPLPGAKSAAAVESKANDSKSDAKNSDDKKTKS